MADEELLNDIRKRLLETGDWDRIMSHLRHYLEETGFDDDVKDLAKETARRQGAPSLAQLVAEVTPQAQNQLPPKVRENMLREIEAALEKIVERY